ncbi:MAG: isoprenylcysteine carboxylmethyltransferase family protein [Bacteroidetes bacterium]|nr:isoprenylcysteine carboxylmethyltransferase family protein [Bacteroidota bacterium]
MERALLETIFLCGIALLVFLEIYYLQNFGADRKILNVQKKKRTFLFLLILGMQVIPLIYIFSIDFGPTDYHLWNWLGFPVILFYLFCIWLFVRAMSDLGRWWTPGQELKDDLEMVTTGTYLYIRHPMYAALLGIAICQIFMIQNWIAGPVSLFLATPFCIYQIRREERLLIKCFGDDYREYIKTTGMLWPKEDKMPLLKKLVQQSFQLLKQRMLKLRMIARRKQG